MGMSNLMLPMEMGDIEKVDMTFETGVETWLDSIETRSEDIGVDFGSLCYQRKPHCI